VNSVYEMTFKSFDRLLSLFNLIKISALSFKLNDGGKGVTLIRDVNKRGPISGSFSESSASLSESAPEIQRQPDEIGRAIASRAKR
jgi:hypothetical protein